ncbi:MAG TPA: toprim domain-containing protein [Candidatus Paceibacterota bacterium]
MSDIISQLTELFMQFPGIGPRQARRFVYFLLRQDSIYIKTLLEQIKELRESVNECKSCFRFFLSKGFELENRKSTCELCSDIHADKSILLIIEKDVDLENVRKTGKFRGQYFVLGGLLPILEKQPESRIRINELRRRLEKDKDIKEVILALSANPMGDNTIDYLRLEISKYLNIIISTLGRGLSTGTELEYSDSSTLSHALENRR